MPVFRKQMELSAEIQEQIRVIAEHARREGLDFPETIFEPVNYDEMSALAAYGGFPQRYRHWRFGMEYERMRKQQGYGLGKIYEMVINTDPCYAYLLDDNAFVDQKLVIGHVYAHADFFKNNAWFSPTNTNMVNGMANHATRVRRHIDRVGEEAVEIFIDECLSLDDLIDPHSKFINRGPSKPPRDQDDDDPFDQKAATRFEASQYMDPFINPASKMRREQEDARAEKERIKLLDPQSPVRDVMLFLLNRAPLKDWQADILSIIREEAYYFAPQGQTKIMNEGWASYWHSVIMTRYAATDADIIAYCKSNAGTMASSPGQINPYKVGVELFRDIEDRWNRGACGREYEECDDMGVRRRWGEDIEVPRALADNTPGRKKIFEVRRHHNDITFLDEFLTPEFIEKHQLYSYQRDDEGNMSVITRDFRQVKARMLFSLTNHGQPYIFITDANYGNRGELCLGHKRIYNFDLEAKWAEETLKIIQRMWKRPVSLFAIINDDPCRFHVDNDGEVSLAAVADRDMPKPVHEIS